jgi:hypothetical protein
MSSEIQRKNHRIHPCNTERKNELLNFLIGHHPEKKILIATAKSPESIKITSSNNITIVADDEMKGSEKNQYDILISYDLPEKAILYMTRFAHAREMALVLLGAEDQKNLYGIETLLGRTIIQEAIAGFEPSFGIAIDNQQKAEAKARRDARNEEEALKKEKWAKKDKEKPRFLGKDDNGKPIFEKKTRDRNHYIDGTPRNEDEKSSKTQYSNKPVFFGDDKKQFNKPKPEGERKPHGDKKSFGDKKPFGDKKAFGDKKPYGDKKPFGDKKAFGDKKPYDASAKSRKPDFAKPAPSESALPKRAPRRINVKSLKPSEDKQ